MASAPTGPPRSPARSSARALPGAPPAAGPVAAVAGGRGADHGFAAFAAGFFVLHQAWVVLPATLPVQLVVGLLTPLAGVGAAAVVLRSFGWPRRAVALGAVAATVYAQACGAHAAANSIDGASDAPLVTFWDERYGHIAAVAGWLGLLAALCLAEHDAARPRDASGRLLLLAGVLLGCGAFVTTVEGQAWWALPPGAALFAAWAARGPGPLLRTVAGALVLATALLAGWAAWHGGVPELTDL